MNDQFIDVLLDLMPNAPKNEQTKKDFGNILRQTFEQHLPEAVERIWELPPIMLQGPSKGYAALLIEARNLFIAGYFYSCVAMCGIVGERLIKDTFRASILTYKAGTAIIPPEEAFEQFERVDVSGISRFLKKAGVLTEEGEKAAHKLSELRNGYAHARGKEPATDAVTAIKHLHELIESTVSVFKDFEITEKGLVKRSAI
jgi:hypothetical protein